MANVSISTASSGNNTIIAAGTPNTIYRVTSVALVAAGTVTVQWLSNATALSGAMTLIQGVPYILPLTPARLFGLREGEYFETAPGEALILSLGGNVQVSGHLTYQPAGV